MTNTKPDNRLWAAGVRARFALDLLDDETIDRRKLREHLTLIDELSKGEAPPIVYQNTRG